MHALQKENGYVPGLLLNRNYLLPACSHILYYTLVVLQADFVVAVQRIRSGPYNPRSILPFAPIIWNLMLTSPFLS